MRISDWSSDVCSSDLLGPGPKSRACLSCRLAIDGDAADVFVRRLRLGQGDSQHAVLEAGVRVVAVDPFRQADAPLEASIAAFGIAAVLVRDLGLLLAAQRQNTFLHGDFDVLLVAAGKFRRHPDFLVADRKSTR